IDITIDANRLTVDLGSDGTIDTQLPRSQVSEVQVLGRGGDDGLLVHGTAQVPVTINGGIGDDFIAALGTIGDARTVVRGQDGNDNVLAATPGPIIVSTGAGDDTVEGGGAGIGHESVSLGDGNDNFVSSLNAFVGARRDIVDGGTGKDGMEIR